MEDIKDVLIELNKRINRIETRNSNFAESSKWKKLREMQDRAFLILAKENLYHYETEPKLRDKDGSKSKIMFYKKYINDAEAKK